MRKILPLAAAFAVLLMPLAASATSTSAADEPSFFDEFMDWVLAVSPLGKVIDPNPPLVNRTPPS
jgi:hypothetical protein